MRSLILKDSLTVSLSDKAAFITKCLQNRKDWLLGVKILGYERWLVASPGSFQRFWNMVRWKPIYPIFRILLSTSLMAVTTALHRSLLTVYFGMRHQSQSLNSGCQEITSIQEIPWRSYRSLNTCTSG